MRRLVRLSLVGLVALVALGFWLQQNQPKSQPVAEVKLSVGLCQSSGTGLVIDFGVGNNIETIQSCVTNFVGTSWNLMKRAGLEVTGTEKYPNSFLCRINGIPDSTKDKCIDTPGIQNGSWAFYIYDEGTWTYSPYGAASHQVKCGTTEGWRYLEPGEAITNTPRVTPKTLSCEN